MTIDVEDYFHVSVFDGVVPRSHWEPLESRVVPQHRATARPAGGARCPRHVLRAGVGRGASSGARARASPRQVTRSRLTATAIAWCTTRPRPPFGTTFDAPRPCSKRRAGWRSTATARPATPSCRVPSGRSTCSSRRATPTTRASFRSAMTATAFPCRPDTPTSSIDPTAV